MKTPTSKARKLQTERKAANRKTKSAAANGKGNGHKPALNTRHWRTDVANAQHLIDFYGNSMRYCHTWKRWLVWDGKRWAEDHIGAALRNAKRVAENLRREATRDGKPLCWSFAARVANRTRLEAMLSLAAPEMPVLPRQ